MEELTWINDHEWIEMNELKRMNWSEWLETNELKWMNWNEWIEKNELPKCSEALSFCYDFYVINYLMTMWLTHEIELSPQSRAHFVGVPIYSPFGCFHKWAYPQMMVYTGTYHLIMDDDWGVALVQKTAKTWIFHAFSMALGQPQIFLAIFFSENFPIFPWAFPMFFPGWYFQPLWKIWVRQLRWLATQYFWENKIHGNQTTNQLCNGIFQQVRLIPYFSLRFSHGFPMFFLFFASPKNCKSPAHRGLPQVVPRCCETAVPWGPGPGGPPGDGKGGHHGNVEMLS